MCRRGPVELPPFDPEPETTLHRLHRELREARQRNLATMQNNEGHGQDQEQNEPQGGHNGNNGLPYYLQLFSLLSEDHPFRQTTSS